tara:strand:- start:308 stop:769 length:462 start_codon:yes stop_codon:yes gene_type:complete
MKRFNNFQEDAYAGRQGAGAWLTGKALEYGLKGAKKAYQIGKTVYKSVSSDDLEKKLGWGKIARDARKEDDVGRELDVKQNQAKDAAKNKEFDTDLKALRKGKDNISNEDKIEILKNAAKKHRKYKNKSPEITGGSKPKGGSSAYERFRQNQK